VFDFSTGDGDMTVSDCCLTNGLTIGISDSEIDGLADEDVVKDGLADDVTDIVSVLVCDTLGDKLTDDVFETVGEPAGVKLGDIDGVGDGESKLINILNVYLHTGLSLTNVIVVEAPYWYRKVALRVYEHENVEPCVYAHVHIPGDSVQVGFLPNTIGAGLYACDALIP